MEDLAPILVRIGPDVFAVARAQQADANFLAPFIDEWLTGSLPGNTEVEMALQLAGLTGPGG